MGVQTNVSIPALTLEEGLIRGKAVLDVHNTIDFVGNERVTFSERAVLINRDTMTWKGGNITGGG